MEMRWRMAKWGGGYMRGMLALGSNKVQVGWRMGDFQKMIRKIKLDIRPLGVTKIQHTPLRAHSSCVRRIFKINLPSQELFKEPSCPSTLTANHQKQRRKLEFA